MRITINGAQPFQVLATNFSIGPSNEGYTLQISADGRNFSDLFTVPANTTRMVTSVANGSTYRLNGNNSEVVVNWERQCGDSGGGSGSGGTDPAVVQQMIDASLLDYTQDLIDGEPIVGMAAQLYSPDGVDSEGLFNYRTTAGDADVNSGVAELKQVGGNSVYPETAYDDSASLSRGGEPVTGFSADIYWGDTSEWVQYTSTGQTAELQPQSFKLTLTNNIYGRVAVNLKDPLFPNNTYYAQFNCTTAGTLTTYDNVTAVTPTELVFGFSDIPLAGTIVRNGDNVITTITAGTGYIRNISLYNGIEGTSYILTGGIIPNDISAGTHTYTYSDSTSAWTPSLPQAITAMTVDGSEYVPQDGDVLTVVRNLVKSGSAVYPAPTKFVAVGLNSFNKEGSTAISQFSEESGVYTVAVLGVADLENGYTIYDKNSGITAVGIADSATGTVDTTGAVIDAALSYVTPTEAKPYIIVTTTDIDGLCIHPRWSGYRDEDFEDYMEDEVELASYNSTCPLYSVGSTRNIWDFNGGKLIRNIGTTAYTADAVEALINDGKVIGTDFDFDENYIYIVLDEPVEISAPKEQLYEANDFGVEFFADANGIIPAKAYAATWYMQNLVDKLRRMEGLIHLDSLSGTGAENTIYECDDKLWYWKDSDGIVAEWTDNPATFGNDRGYGLIFSHIPNGQKLLEYRYPYGGDWRYLIMSGDTLVATETGGSIVTSCTVGNTVEFPASQYGNSYKIRVSYQKHYLGMWITNYINLQNVWSGNVSGGHWGIVDHTNYPWLNITADDGMPVWNNKGQIIKKARNNSSKGIQFNTNASQYSTTGKIEFLTDGTNNGPSRIFVPTQGGTAGQMLISAGDNAEPTWTNWIKSVQITTAEYEALVTKDPNTLYLIVDE